MPEVLGDYPDYGLIYPVNEPLDAIIRPNFKFDFSTGSFDSANAGNASGAFIVDMHEFIVGTVTAAMGGAGLFGKDNQRMAISSSIGELTSGGYLTSVGVTPNRSDWDVSLAFLYGSGESAGAIIATLTSNGSLSLADATGARLASATVSDTDLPGFLSLAWDGFGRYSVSWGDSLLTASYSANVYGAMPILNCTGKVVSLFSGSVANGFDFAPSGYSRGAFYGQTVIDGDYIAWPLNSSSGEDSDSGASLASAVSRLAEESITPFIGVGYIPSHFPIVPLESSDAGTASDDWISNASFGVDPILSSDLTPDAVLVNFKTTDHSAYVQGIHKEYPILAEHTLVGLRLKDVTVESQAFDPEVIYTGDFVDASISNASFVPVLGGSDLSASTFSILLDDILAESGSGATIDLSSVEIYGSELIGCRITDLEVNASSSISGLNISVGVLDSSDNLIYGEAIITDAATPLNYWIETSISGGATPIPDAAGITLVEANPSGVIDVELNWESGSDAASLAIILSANDGAPVTPDSITLSGVEWLYGASPINIDFGLIDSEGNGVAGSGTVSTMGATPNGDWQESGTYAQVTLSSQLADTCDITFAIDRVGDGLNLAAIIAYGPEYPVSIGFSRAVWIFKPAYSLEIVDGPEDYALEVVNIAQNYSGPEMIFGRTSGHTNLADYVEIFNMIIGDSGWPSGARLCGPNTHVKAREEGYDTVYTIDTKSFTADSRDIAFLLGYITLSDSDNALVANGLAFSAEYDTVDEWLGLVRYIRQYLNPGIRIVITSIFSDNISTTDVKDIVDALNEEMLGYDVIFVSASESSSSYKQTIRSGEPPPSVDKGARGDIYIDTDSSSPVQIYGPKGIGSGWGDPIALDFPSVEVSPTAPVDESVLWFRNSDFVNSIIFSKYSAGATAMSYNSQTGLVETISERPMARITNGYGTRDPSSIISAADSSGSCLIVDGYLSATTSGSITVPPRQSSGAIFFRTLDFADNSNGIVRLNVRLDDIIPGLDHPVLNVAGYTIPSLVFSIGNHVLNDPSINPLTGWDVYDCIKVTVCFPTQASGIATTTKIIMEAFCSENGETTDFNPQQAITVANVGSLSQNNHFRETYTLSRALRDTDVLSIVSNGEGDIDLELNGNTITSAATWISERTGSPMADLNQACIMTSFVERTQNVNGASHILPVTSVDVMLGVEYEFEPQGIFYHNGSDWALIPELRSLGRTEFYYPVAPPSSYAWTFESVLTTPIDLNSVQIGMLIYSRNMSNGIVRISGGGRDLEFPLGIDSVSAIGNLDAGTYNISLYGDVLSSGVETLRFGISADNMSRLLVSDTMYIKGTD